MKRILLTIILAAVATVAMNATTKTFYAYVPSYMNSLGTMTISYNSSSVDLTHQGEKMHLTVQNILTSYEGTIYLLYNKADRTYWILAIANSDGALFKSNSSYSVRDMKAYLSTTRLQR